MIEIDDVSKSFGNGMAVDHVSLTVPAHTVCAVVGTSGSGKTTLLRMINRLIDPTSGQIRVDGKDTRKVPAYEIRRRMGYVIQGHGLFPHWTVAQNVATVPKLLGWQRRDIDARVDELLDLFGLDPADYRNRLPSELSGGQRQRVGVARALAARPNILLMDEPFGALDPLTRAKAQQDLRAIQKRFGTTILLVTHDMEEAILLGDRIAVMDKGHVLQSATPAEIIAHPATGFVTDLLGTGDRAFRLLSVSQVGEHVEPGQGIGEPIDAGTSLREAYSELLWSGRAAAPVIRDGQVVGSISRDTLTRLAARPQ
jgi:osmoprotectant transport system ATP-binding protein